MTDYDDLLQSAVLVIAENAYHNGETLWAYLSRLYPDMTNEQFDRVMEAL